VGECLETKALFSSYWGVGTNYSVVTHRGELVVYTDLNISSRKYGTLHI